MGQGRKFEHLSMPDEVFMACNMAPARFDNVNLGAAPFRNINLQGASFDDINMKNVCIENANVAGLTICGYDIHQLLGPLLERDDRRTGGK